MAGTGCKYAFAQTQVTVPPTQGSIRRSRLDWASRNVARPWSARRRSTDYHARIPDFASIACTSPTA